MISIRHAFLFIHRGKSGGNSVSEVLLPYSEDQKHVTGSQDGTERFDVQNDTLGTRKHSRLADYKRALPEEVFNRLYKFSIIRNPFERLVSAYFSPHRLADRQIGGFDRAAFLQLIEGQATLRDFTCTRPGGTLDAELDRLMRFERLEQDFGEVLRALGLPAAPLPHRNRGQHAPYRAYYDAELRKLVETRFREELDWGGYVF
ncbi:sulfotransferase family 2 domain-containing protein [Falsiroseomonas tokyonensis]|uniref:Sulfotransferase family 2 domain-containing protein n=1 Tax=Falsiroseomonas tokyonensis TaxID=430521 RepID=A0ABV7C512_9PROT|nr:sulfotransferase family 2 domain-containing protein [Falsiroseomonas tokyonensis]